MTDERDSNDSNNDQDGYQIGFRKPPKETQFQKGQSGNPRGRPKAPTTFEGHLERQGKCKITVMEDGRKKKITKEEAIATQMTNRAVQGTATDRKLYLEARGQAKPREKRPIRFTLKINKPNANGNPNDDPDKNGNPAPQAVSVPRTR